MTEKIKQLCPFMSCRLINKSNQPMLIKCQGQDCALFDDINSQCVARSVVAELIKVGENV